MTARRSICITEILAVEARVIESGAAGLESDPKISDHSATRVIEQEPPRSQRNMRALPLV
jgi:hypothetical protein